MDRESHASFVRRVTGYCVGQSFVNGQPRWSQGQESGCDSSRHREVLVRVSDSLVEQMRLFAHIVLNALRKSIETLNKPSHHNYNTSRSNNSIFSALHSCGSAIPNHLDRKESNSIQDRPGWCDWWIGWKSLCCGWLLWRTTELDGSCIRSQNGLLVDAYKHGHTNAGPWNRS